MTGATLLIRLLIGIHFLIKLEFSLTSNGVKAK
jgi:hypothetical protein